MAIERSAPLESSVPSSRIAATCISPPARKKISWRGEVGVAAGAEDMDEPIGRDLVRQPLGGAVERFALLVQDAPHEVLHRPEIAGTERVGVG